MAVDFLKNRKEGPFFLVLSIGPPHDPYGAPEKYRKMYDPQKLTMRPNWKEGVPHAGREQIADYDASITAIDDQVGRLMRTLKDLDLEKNTIVLFTADHGDMLGSQGAAAEAQAVGGIDPRARRPALAGPRPGWASDGRSVFARRFRPDAAGAVRRRSCRRRCRAPTCRGWCWARPTQGPESAFFQIFVPFDGDGTPFGWRGVRTAQTMYARSEKAPWVLYDLEKDPDELHNLANDPAAESLRRTWKRAWPSG